MFQQIEVKRRGLTGALTLTIILLTYAVIIPAVSAVADYEITLLSHTYDGTHSYWQYEVKVYSTAPAGLSHVIIEWCGGVDSVIAAGPGNWEYRPPDDPDPSSGKWGIKIDFGVDKPTTGYNTGTFSFQLLGDYAEGTVTAWVKAGTNSYPVTTTGPVFSFSVIGEITGTGADDTWLSATATTDLPVTRTVTFYWYGPSASGTSLADPNKLWDGINPWPENPGSFTEDWVESITGTSPFVSTLHEMTIDHLGEWYVVAKLDGGVHEANDIVEVTLVPWFTSLPLAMLVTVGAVFLLRKKGHLKLAF